MHEIRDTTAAAVLPAATVLLLVSAGQKDRRRSRCRRCDVSEWRLTGVIKCGVLLKHTPAAMSDSDSKYGTDLDDCVQKYKVGFFGDEQAREKIAAAICVNEGGLTTYGCDVTPCKYGLVCSRFTFEDGSVASMCTTPQQPLKCYGGSWDKCIKSVTGILDYYHPDDSDDNRITAGIQCGDCPR